MFLIRHSLSPAKVHLAHSHCERVVSELVTYDWWYQFISEYIYFVTKLQKPQQTLHHKIQEIYIVCSVKL